MSCLQIVSHYFRSNAAIVNLPHQFIRVPGDQCVGVSFDCYQECRPLINQAVVQATKHS